MDYFSFKIIDVSMKHSYVKVVLIADGIETCMLEL